MEHWRWKSGKYEHVVSGLRKEFNQLFDRLWSGQVEPMEAGRWVPPVDIAETDNEVIVWVEVPGLDPADVDILVEGDVLTLRGEKREIRDAPELEFHRTERQYGSFLRNIQLPVPILIEAITATVRNGILEVRLPKQEQARPRKVNITTEPMPSQQPVSGEGPQQPPQTPPAGAGMAP